MTEKTIHRYILIALALLAIYTIAVRCEPPEPEVITQYETIYKIQRDTVIIDNTGQTVLKYQVFHPDREDDEGG